MNKGFSTPIAILIMAVVGITMSAMIRYFLFFNENLMLQNNLEAISLASIERAKMEKMSIKELAEMNGKTIKLNNNYSMQINTGKIGVQKGNKCQAEDKGEKNCISDVFFVLFKDGKRIHASQKENIIKESFFALNNDNKHTISEKYNEETRNVETFVDGRLVNYFPQPDYNKQIYYDIITFRQNWGNTPDEDMFSHIIEYTATKQVYARIKIDYQAYFRWISTINGNELPVNSVPRGKGNTIFDFYMQKGDVVKIWTDKRQNDNSYGYPYSFSYPPKNQTWGRGAYLIVYEIK